MNYLKLLYAVVCASFIGTIGHASEAGTLKEMRDCNGGLRLSGKGLNEQNIQTAIKMVSAEPDGIAASFSGTGIAGRKVIFYRQGEKGSPDWSGVSGAHGYVVYPTLEGPSLFVMTAPRMDREGIIQPEQQGFLSIGGAILEGEAPSDAFKRRFYEKTGLILDDDATIEPCANHHINYYITDLGSMDSSTHFIAYSPNLAEQLKSLGDEKRGSFASVPLSTFRGEVPLKIETTNFNGKPTVIKVNITTSFVLQWTFNPNGNPHCYDFAKEIKEDKAEYHVHVTGEKMKNLLGLT